MVVQEFNVLITALDLFGLFGQFTRVLLRVLGQGRQPLIFLPHLLTQLRQAFAEAFDLTVRHLGRFK